MRECTKLLIADLEKEVQNDKMIAILNRAKQDYYHDFFGGAELPEFELLADLKEAKASEQICQNVINGKYDASKEDSDEWAKSAEGREAFNDLLQGIQKNRKLPPGLRRDDE